MLPLIPKYDALMMANHGAVCYGEDVFKAYFKMETMEHFARIQLVAELLGGPKVLPRDGSGQAAGFADALRSEGQERRGAELSGGGRRSGHEQLAALAAGRRRAARKNIFTYRARNSSRWWKTLSRRAGLA